MRVEGVSSLTIKPVQAGEQNIIGKTSEHPRHTGRNPAENAVGMPAGKTGKAEKIGEQELIKMIERANEAINGANRRFEFSIHEDTRAIMVKVINSETNELIREIPPEKILDMVAKMWEMAGIFVDEKI